MKRNIIIVSLLIACSLLTHVEGADKKKKIEEELTGVPRPELAARVSELVRQAPAHERKEVAAAAVEVVSEKYPTAVNTVLSAVSRDVPAKDNGNRNEGKVNGNNGNGNGNGNANGGVGHGPGPDKPGHQVSPRPINSTLPNGKPRHFPPDPPRRPVDPPRPIHYNAPRQH